MAMSDDELTAAMEAAVDANHRRAQQRERGPAEAPRQPKEMSMWAALIIVGLLGLSLILAPFAAEGNVPLWVSIAPIAGALFTAWRTGWTQK